MSSWVSLPSLHGIGRGRWAALALAAGAVGYVGVVTYRWRRHRVERSTTGRAKWSRIAVFSSGIAMGVIAMAIVPTLRRWRSPRPDKVFTSVLPILRANREVRELVGNGLQPGLFRACVYDGGVKWGGVRWSGAKSGRAGLIPLTFPPYTLQLLFQVHGEHSSAMVSLAVRNHTLWGRGLIYDSLVVDLPNGERLVLKGQRSDRAVLQAYTQRLQ